MVAGMPPFLIALRTKKDSLFMKAFGLFGLYRALKISTTRHSGRDAINPSSRSAVGHKFSLIGERVVDMAKFVAVFIMRKFYQVTMLRKNS